MEINQMPKCRICGAEVKEQPKITAEGACSISAELIKQVQEFHGHLGPFLILGVKAGLFANYLLGKDYFKTTAIVLADLNPPRSCFVDGIQFVTGCTMGKRNIKLRKSKNVSVLFLKEGKKLRLTLKDTVLESIKDISSEEESAEVSLTLLGRPVSELFKVEK
jgi:formylmethanofuran dehydrogenase subunit E